MQIEQNGETLAVSGINTLNAANSQTFRRVLCGSLPAEVKTIKLDLSETQSIDCRGLGALVALQKCAARKNRKVAINVVNPSPRIQRLFELTHMDRFFEIVPR
jgi:anti-anti-sigma factor